MLAGINRLQPNAFETLTRNAHAFKETLLTAVGNVAARFEQARQYIGRLPRAAWFAMQTSLFTLAAVGLIGCGALTNASATPTPVHYWEYMPRELQGSLVISYEGSPVMITDDDLNGEPKVEKLFLEGSDDSHSFSFQVSCPQGDYPLTLATPNTQNAPEVSLIDYCANAERAIKSALAGN